MQIFPELAKHNHDINESSTPIQHRVIVLHHPKDLHQNLSSCFGTLDHNKSSTRRIRNVNISKTIPTSYNPKVRFALWNARSIKNKFASLCDFIISRQIDVMVVTETWLNGDSRDDRTIADFSNTLPTHVISHLPRLNRMGGGIATIIRKGLTITENNPIHNYSAMECLDINLNAGNKSLRLISIYRPHSSNKNGLTPAMFFDDFSSLIENYMSSVATSIFIWTWIIQIPSTLKISLNPLLWHNMLTASPTIRAIFWIYLVPSLVLISFPTFVLAWNCHLTMPH
jgi:hypothetical protein